jgi:hypothetical protein
MVTYHGVECLVAAKATTPAFGDADSVFDFHVEEGRELFTRYELGSEDPQEIKGGKIKISGGFSRHFDGTDFSDTSETLKDLVDQSLAMHVAIFPEGDALPKVDCEDAKFSNWRFSVDLDGLAVESVDFEGLAITIT